MLRNKTLSGLFIFVLVAVAFTALAPLSLAAGSHIAGETVPTRLPTYKFFCWMKVEAGPEMIRTGDEVRKVYSVGRAGLGWTYTGATATVAMGFAGREKFYSAYGIKKNGVTRWVLR